MQITYFLLPCMPDEQKPDLFIFGGGGGGGGYPC